MNLEFIFSILMMISAVMLVVRWFSLAYNSIDLYITLFTLLLMSSLGALLLGITWRMKNTREELGSMKRIIMANTSELEKRLDQKLEIHLKELKDKLDEIERRLYR
ncbi:MAG TPA: hypothetical protein EYH00_05050 [Archaeoglobus profundus]|nr:hypothetical protein [Archaeoglobus profundus]